VPERVVALTEEVSGIANDKVERIQTVTQRTKLLAINALIEAAHAGERGKGFAVVAQEVGQVSDEIKQLSDSLTSELAPRLDDLDALGRQLVQQVRGGRLADLALGMIDIIDRNLYERSCDVRWWATDAAIVDCCAAPSADARTYASKRLGVILDSYTVYLDLWVADLKGNVIANGRPDRYPHAQGTNVANEAWFRQALGTKSGEDFSVADITVNAKLNDSLVATYATAVRAEGEADGEVIGAMGIYFDWTPQSLGVLQGVRIADVDKPTTRLMLLDSNFRIIASSDGHGILRETYPLQTSEGLMGYYTDADGKVIGYALTPGYETYAGLGWYGVIEQIPPSGKAR
jgi:hypothetical protein